MSFNKKIKEKNNKIRYNHEGSEVYQLEPLQILFSKVLGSFFGSKTFYEDRNIESEFNYIYELIKELPEEDKEYVLKIAEIGRLNGMKTFPIVLLAIAMEMDEFKGKNFIDQNGKNKLSIYSENIIRRVKDINEILAIHFTYFNEKGIPNQMRKILKKKLESYNKYKLMKGLDRRKYVSLADTIKLLHPTPINEEMAKYYKDIIEDKVRLEKEFKNVLTEIGQKKEIDKEEIKKDLKEVVYNSNYEPLIKNIYNLYKNDLLSDDELVDYICKEITNETKIIKSKIMPYQLYGAYSKINDILEGLEGNIKIEKIKETKINLRRIKESLKKAGEISIQNTKEINGYNSILIDTSYSMCYPISNKGSISAYEMALLLGLIAFKKGNGDIYVFSNDCIELELDKNLNLFDLVEIAEQRIMATIGNRGTELENALKYIWSKGIKYDNLIVFSDQDCYASEIFGYDETGKNMIFRPNKLLDKLIKAEVTKKVWINNMLGNDFSIIKSNDLNKFLIPSYTDKFIDMIEIYNMLDNKNIRKVIDTLLEKSRENNKRH